MSDGGLGSRDSALGQQGSVLLSTHCDCCACWKERKKAGMHRKKREETEGRKRRKIKTRRKRIGKICKAENSGEGKVKRILLKLL
jgi:hypothetical protein